MQRLAGNNSGPVRVHPVLKGRGRVSSRGTAGPLSRGWERAVIAMVVVFYVATVYDRELAGWLFYMKWLTVLPVIALSWRAAGRVGVALAAPPSSLPLVLIAFAALLSVFAALDMGQSAVIFISLVFALVTAFTLAMAIMRTGGSASSSMPSRLSAASSSHPRPQCGRWASVSDAVMSPVFQPGRIIRIRWRSCLPPRSSY